ncbi:MAG: thioredoxin [Bacteroidales bacterium]|nr:thioredoxin [Bacteroidales bacterium]
MFKKILNILFVLAVFANLANAQKPIHIDEATFKKEVFDYENAQEWKYLGDKPAIVDFYADWCAPCKRIAPIMEELAQEYEGKIIIYKVNTDNNRNLAAAFGIQSIPSILFIPMQGKPTMGQGAYPKETFEKAIHEILNVKK